MSCLQGKRPLLIVVVQIGEEVSGLFGFEGQVCRQLDQYGAAALSIRIEDVEKSRNAGFRIIQLFGVGDPPADLWAKTEVLFYRFLPMLNSGRRWQPVKAAIDLGSVKPGAVIRQLLGDGKIGWIEYALPVFIAPSRSAYMYFACAHIYHPANAKGANIVPLAGIFI